MEYSVTCQSVPVAPLFANSQGLYWQLVFSCPKPEQTYLFVKTSEAAPPFCLGTLVPTDGRWSLEKRVSKKQLPLSPDSRFFLSSKENCPVICGIAVENGKIVRQNGKKQLLVPFVPGTPFPLIEKIRFFSFNQYGDSICLQCDLNEENIPVFVDNAANCDTINEVS